MRALEVRAHLASGIAQAAPWGIALDGLLAAQLWPLEKERLIAAGDYSTRALQQENPPDLSLPLARCGGSEAWHWSSTCAWPGGDIDVEVRMWSGRVDHRDLEVVADRLPKTVSDRQGRYRARFMPLLVTPTAMVSWYAVGDLEHIRDLLEPLPSIGKKRTSGEGHVLRWEFLARPDLDEFTAGHLHPDGSLGRPTPPSCLVDRVVADGGSGTAGIRPPYMHPSRQHTLQLPALASS